MAKGTFVYKYKSVDEAIRHAREAIAYGFSTTVTLGDTVHVVVVA